MKKVVAVYDTDTAYATRFTEYINQKKELEFDFYGFTKLENLKEYLISNPVEILLLGGNIDMEELPKEHVKYILILSDNSQKLVASQYHEIYKFQSMHTILSEIISYYANQDSNPDKFRYDTNTKFISIYSPVLGSNKLIFAWFMASLLSEKMKTLFISLELYPVETIYTDKGSTSGLSDFLYFLKEDNPNLIMVMKSLLQHHGKLSYLTGVSHGFDLISITKEDMSKWMEHIRLYSDYQVVIFYISFYNEVMMDLLKNCEKVFLVKEKNNYESALMKEWERQMSYIGGMIDEDNVMKINIPDEDLSLITDSNMEDIHQNKIWNIAEDQVDKLLKGGFDGSVEGRFTSSST